MTEPIQGMTQLQKRLAAITDTRKLLGTVGLLAVSKAKAIVPRKTGNLGRTIRLGQVTATSVQIIAGGQFGVGYARDVEFGTKAHDITPKTAKALSWPASKSDARLSGSVRTGGNRRFAKRVHHPGTTAQPYLVPGAQQAIQEAGVNTIIAAWNEAA